VPNSTLPIAQARAVCTLLKGLRTTCGASSIIKHANILLVGKFLVHS